METRKKHEDSSYLGKEICVKGWIIKYRNKKEIDFIESSAGTCTKFDYEVVLKYFNIYYGYGKY